MLLVLFMPLPYPLKTSETGKVFWCFQGMGKGCNGNKWAKRYIDQREFGSLNLDFSLKNVACKIFLELIFTHMEKSNFVKPCKYETKLN